MGFALEWHPGMVHFRYFGTVTGDEILESNLAVYGDGRFDELQYEIASFAEEVVLEVEPDTIRRIAYLDRAAYKSNPRIRVVLVGNETVQERIFQIYAEHSDPGGWEVIAFPTLGEAYQFVGLDPV